MTVTEIHAPKGRAADELRLTAGGGPRQLSLADGGALLLSRGMEGLCTRRFDSDLITEGLDYSLLKVGDRFRIGGAAIELTQTEKRCYPECPLRRQGLRCPLPGHTAFAQVTEGGAIRRGNGIRKIDQGEETDV